MTPPLAVACPLSWAVALRRNAREPTGALREATLRWLRSHGWREAPVRHHRGLLLLDPLEGSVRWFLGFAVRLQSTRDSQRVLSPLGWELTCGTTDPHFGCWADVLEVRHRDRAGYYSLTAALRREGQTTPPALERLQVRPKLRLIRGGGGTAA